MPRTAAGERKLRLRSCSPAPPLLLAWHAWQPRPVRVDAAVEVLCKTTIQPTTSQADTRPMHRALHLAMLKHNPAAVETLLSNGADKALKDTEGTFHLPPPYPHLASPPLLVPGLHTTHPPVHQVLPAPDCLPVTTVSMHNISLPPALSTTPHPPRVIFLSSSTSRLNRHTTTPPHALLHTQATPRWTLS